MNLKSISIKIAVLLIFVSCKTSFVTVEGNQFVRNNKTYGYVGTNYWYGALLGMKSGDRDRLKKELDFMKSKGIDNLRILVGAEGGDQDYTVRTALQPKQGEYNEDVFDGLDYLLNEMKKRKMVAVLYLGNNWEWSGGFAKYLEWNGYGEVPNPNIKDYTWPDYMKHTPKFFTCDPCKESFLNHIKKVIGRTNPYSNIKYTEDKTIMAWQVANEPRVFDENMSVDDFTNWLNPVINLINELDPNHLISTGSEGLNSSRLDMNIFEKSHANPNIDYLTMHMWAKNWGWYDPEDEEGSFSTVKQNANDYLAKHISTAEKMNKPIVLEEFGFPREKESISKTSSTSKRDTYYQIVFEKLEESFANKKPFVGINFWAFGGFAKNNPNHPKWEIGDDFTGDPPQEPQGLNSVFATDTTTINIIKKTNEDLDKLQKKIKKTKPIK